ncbi:MAG: hypothetical protein M3Q31_22380, partial [Actinomycetota bacterium]|nr:hypothetical protein [Actinomycetota bacterium]
ARRRSASSSVCGACTSIAYTLERRPRRASEQEAPAQDALVDNRTCVVKYPAMRTPIIAALLSLVLALAVSTSALASSGAPPS